jgi:hypothetical protein
VAILRGRFSVAGPHDRQGRSLGELDLRKFMFRHPYSYLIGSPAFAQLPLLLRESIYRRLHAILTDDRLLREFSLSRASGQAILEILQETHGDLPDYFRSSG